MYKIKVRVYVGVREIGVVSRGHALHKQGPWNHMVNHPQSNVI